MIPLDFSANDVEFCTISINNRSDVNINVANISRSLMQCLIQSVNTTKYSNTIYGNALTNDLKSSLHPIIIQYIHILRVNVKWVYVKDVLNPNPF